MPHCLTNTIHLLVELYKNGDSSALGKILQDQLEKDDGTKKSKTIQWYRKSYSIIQKELGEMVKAATPGGSIDSSKLSAESLELLNMYIENQVGYSSKSFQPKLFSLSRSLSNI